MKKFLKGFALGSLVIFAGSLTLCRATNTSKPTQEEGDALMAMIHVVNHTTLPYKAAVLQQMLMEANYFANRLQLPMPRPVQMNDVVYSHVTPPWFSVINETNYPHFPATIFGRGICDTNIPMELRLHALKFAVRGVFETTNFFFSFENGKLWEVERLSEHEVEYYARDLDQLVGKPSLIDTNGAYQLATQWLAAVDVDMSALGKLKWTVNQLHYLARGATNAAILPLYYVDFGSKHYPASGPNLKDFDKPIISVEILGTTKELQELELNDTSFSRRPLLFLTNALDLIRTPNPPVKHLENSALPQTNSP